MGCDGTGSQELLKVLNVKAQGTGDMSQIERGIVGPFALTLKSPAIWELESQLLRREAPSDGQMAEGTIPEESSHGLGGQVLIWQPPGGVCLLGAPPGDRNRRT